MSEDSGHWNYMVASAESLKVCSAGERRLDFYKDFSTGRFRNFQLANLYFAGAYEDISFQDLNSSFPPQTWPITAANTNRGIYVISILDNILASRTNGIGRCI